MTHVRTAGNKVAAELLRAVLRVRAREARAAHIARVVAPLRGWLA